MNNDDHQPFPIPIEVSKDDMYKASQFLRATALRIRGAVCQLGEAIMAVSCAMVERSNPSVSAARPDWVTAGMAGAARAALEDPELVLALCDSGSAAVLGRKANWLVNRALKAHDGGPEAKQTTLGLALLALALAKGFRVEVSAQYPRRSELEDGLSALRRAIGSRASSAAAG